ncbi:GMC oxidoreductase [Streptomyces europaeiscabiei]|uniref:GMC oxidoreductase n=1 Tax=Streptomyces europaeiscabiei TaxID=146819 RepID=UPI0029C0152E|nr:GMC oxidoreductase [Streptomyces europaeiscabiei]
MLELLRRALRRRAAATARQQTRPGPGHPLPACRDGRQLHRAPCADHRLSVQRRLGRHRGGDRRRDVARHGHAPVLRAAGTLHLPAEAQGAARQPTAGRAAHHAAEGAALRRRPVPQRRTPRIRRLAADRPRRPRTGRRGQAVAGRTDDPSAVVDSRFRVPGVDRLRIVDASVFPRIPGFFVATPIRMISQKASDVTLATAQGEPR